MLFTLESLPAAEGDCLILHWGTAAAPHLAVIDGGPGRIYDDHLRPRLEEILAHRGLDRLDIDLVMVSHVDNDHVVGVKKLFRALCREVEKNTPVAQRPFAVKRLWHNTFNDILDDALDSHYRQFTASFQASVDGAPNPLVEEKLRAAFAERQGLDAEDSADAAHEIALILAGHGEGRALRTDQQFLFEKNLTAALNAPFKNAQGNATLITTDGTQAAKKISGLSFQILGPQQAEIEALQVDFDKYLSDNGLSAEATLAAYADKSVTNLSSIVCVAMLEDKTILLTGDARGDKILAGLREQGLLDDDEPLFVDVLKVPHHGSARNAAPEFFERIVADAYVFSGNGKHGNPDREALQWLIEARGKDALYAIYLTYPIAEIDANHKKEVVAKGKVWKPDIDSVRTLFDQASQEGYQFTLVDDMAIVIDLGDEAMEW